MTEKISTMWAEHDKNKTLEDILKEGTKFIQDKYGWVPTVAYVNAHQYPDQFKLNSITLVPVSFILPNHYWFSVEEITK